MANLSNIDHDTGQPERVPFDLGSAIYDVVEALATTAAAEDTDLLVRYPSWVPSHPTGDVAVIRQVLLDLTRNAIKFTSGGHVLLEVAPDSREGLDSAIRIFVQDTGRGIEAERLDTVFDPSDDRPRGLENSRRVVESMGGAIGVSSELGAGSTFWFTLPVAQGSAATIDLPTQPASTDLAGTRVLVVDRHVLRRRVLEETLGDLQLRAEGVATVDDAVTATGRAEEADRPFRVTIFDDRVDAAAVSRLAAVSETLVAISARRPGDELNRPTEIDPLPRIGTPVRPSRLIATLRSALGHDEETLIATPDWSVVRGGRQVVPVRVLVVGGPPADRAVLQRMIEREGYAASSVADLNSGMAALELEPIELMLIDCAPPVDGVAATGEVRRLFPDHPDLAIVGIADDITAATRVRFEAAGISELIGKPVRREELRLVVARQLSDEALGRAA